jgi:hypothetical protein
MQTDFATQAASARENKPARAPKVSRAGSGADVTATITVPLKYHHAISQNGTFFRNLRQLGATVDHSALPQKAAVTTRPPLNGATSSARIDDVDDNAGEDVKWQVVPNYQDAEEGDSEWTLHARDAEALERAQARVQDAIARAEKATHVGFLSGIDQVSLLRFGFFALLTMLLGHVSTSCWHQGSHRSAPA